MKSKKYWLEGGVVGIITISLAYIIFFVTGMGDNQAIDYLYLWKTSIFFIVMRNVVIPNLIEFFVIGAVVGWVYGKIFGEKLSKYK